MASVEATFSSTGDHVGWGQMSKAGQFVPLSDEGESYPPQAFPVNEIHSRGGGRPVHPQTWR